ncbi:hypothetical protein [Acholeplasma laidlawii]|uniref:hypothetical protein n=1 Tax=Acholeplasma laidlawii TaxID=2148 RepID=UPI0021F6FC0E|nr:hypothetical protein [Acholeplasma laidlawii]
MKKAWKITSIAFILLILDLGLTLYFLYNYDGVVSEGNQIVYSSKYGYLVFVINFVYLVMVFVASVLNSRYQTVIINASSTMNYTKRLYTSDNYSFILANVCFTFIVATFVSRMTAIFDWIVFGFHRENFFNSTYAIIRSTMPMERYDIITGAIAALIAIPLWFHLEYLKSKKIINPPADFF